MRPASQAPSSDLPAELPPPRELFNFREDLEARLARPPNMRVGHQMLYPPPRHIASEPAEPQPLVPNPKMEALVASLLQADAERLQNPSLSLNRVVFDVFQPVQLRCA